MDPLLAAILGGAVGGVIVAVVESFLGRSREQERWLRDQRQRLYVHFVELAEEASVSHERALDAASRLNTDDVESVALAAEGLTEQMGKAVRTFDVIASPAMRNRAYRVRFLHRTFLRAAHEFANGAATLEGMEAMQRPQISLAEMSDFTVAARRELGSGHDRLSRLVSWYRLSRLNRWWVRRKLNAYQAMRADEEKDPASTD